MTVFDRVRGFSCRCAVTLMAGLVFSPTLFAGNVLHQADRQAEQAQPIEYRPQTPFDQQQAALALEPGNGTIRGVLFHRLDDFGRYAVFPPQPVTTMEGIDIYLYPVTQHLIEYQQLVEKHLRKRRVQLTAESRRPRQVILDDAALNYRKVARSDQYGRYTFTDLKPGKYLLYSLANVTSYFNEDVPVGSSQINYGIYGADTVTHYESQARSRKIDIEHQKFVEVTSDGKVLEVESMFKPIP